MSDAYLNLPLTNPTDFPSACITVTEQWAPGSRPIVAVRGQLGEGAYVSFTTDAHTIESLRTIADHLEGLLGAEAAQ